MFHICVVCGEIFNKPSFRLRKYCSKRCAKKAEREAAKARKLDEATQSSILVAGPTEDDLYKPPCVHCGNPVTYRITLYPKSPGKTAWLCKKCISEFRNKYPAPQHPPKKKSWWE